MRLLTKFAKTHKNVRMLLNEKMTFEAYIEVARNCDVTYQELVHDINKEINLKTPKLTKEEFESLEYEFMDLLIAGDIKEGEVIY